MFVFNIKMNRNLLKNVVIIAVILLLVAVFMVVGYRFYDSTSRVIVNDDIPASDNNIIEINTNNYTNILKDSHENIDKYVGKRIKFTGFVYRLYDFDENQFVLGREMIISSDNHVVVVGFLCRNESNDIDIMSFKERSWVEVEGIITKGEYHGELPIIDVKCVKEVDVPKDEFVYPPDDTFVNTEGRL